MNKRMTERQQTDRQTDKMHKTDVSAHIMRKQRLTVHEQVVDDAVRLRLRLDLSHMRLEGALYDVVSCSVVDSKTVRKGSDWIDSTPITYS
jgi:hypothetical protein